MHGSKENLGGRVEEKGFSLRNIVRDHYDLRRTGKTKRAAGLRMLSMF